MKKQVSIKLIAKDNGWKVWREAMSNDLMKEMKAMDPDTDWDPAFQVNLDPDPGGWRLLSSVESEIGLSQKINLKIDGICSCGDKLHGAPWWDSGPLALS